MVQDFSFKSIVTQLGKEFSAFVKHEGSVTAFAEPSYSLHLESVEAHNFSNIHFRLTFHLHFTAIVSFLQAR
jgi:hypothetical protein